MSNYEYEDDDDFGYESQGNDLVKQLRKANKQKERELAELREQFQSLNKAQRERTVSELLQSRGVNPKIAKFIPEDVADESALSSWLSEYGDAFGLANTTEAAAPNISPEDAAAYKRMTQTVDSGVTPEATQDVMNKLMNASSKEELDDIIRTSGL
jgi:hypothetical protein